MLHLEDGAAAAAAALGSRQQRVHDEQQLLHICGRVTDRPIGGRREATLFAFVLLVLFFLAAPIHASPPRECRRVGKEVIIDETGCELLLVRVNGCAGYCKSVSYFDPVAERTRHTQSTCCRMADSDEIVVELSCGTEKRTLKIPSAISCECAECTADMPVGRGRFFA